MPKCAYTSVARRIFNVPTAGTAGRQRPACRRPRDPVQGLAI